MIVDSHLHVWRADPDYPQPSATIVSPYSDVPLEVYEQYMDEFGIDRAVFVQPLFPGEDNSYVADCAARDRDRFAAVCVVDPRKSTATDTLEFWVKEQHCKGLRLRPIVPAEAECFGSSTTFPLWQRVQDLNVVVNVLCDFEHLPALADLAQRFPEVPILIDHMAHPDPIADSFQKLTQLAQFANVSVKVSGFYSFSKQPYPWRDCDELIRQLYDSFGPNRLLWGSDFPHVLLKCGYNRSVTHLERACPFLSDNDLNRIRGRNAFELYWAKDA